MQNEQVIKDNKTLQQNRIKGLCKGNKQIKMMCVSGQCKKDDIFVCMNQECQCQQQHQKCYKSSVQYAYKKIRSKLIDTRQINQQITITINELIDRLSKVRDELLKITQQKIRYSQLKIIQKIFMNIMQHNQNKQLFTTNQSKYLCQYIQSKHQQFQSDDVVYTLKDKLQTFKQNTISNLQSLTSDLNKIFIKFKQEDHKLARIKRKLNPQQMELTHIIMSKSSIVKTQQLATKLIKFFDNKIKNISLLFKASQHQFSMKTFYNQCGAALNTLLICETNKNKIIGAYTPLNHQGDQQGYIQDDQKRSFIYSLTNDDKFQLINQQQAIYRYKQKLSLCYGNSQILLCDKSDIKQNSVTDLNWNYYNSNYKDDHVQSYQSFNGNQTQYFKTLEWEMWKIDFC